MKNVIISANILIFLFLANLTIHSGSVNFKAEVPKKGFKFSYSNTIKMDIEITMKLNRKEFGKFKSIDNKIVKKDISVLESDEQDVSKIEVTYKTAIEEKIESDEQQTIIIPVSGKTYVIEKIDNKLNITNKSGGIPSEEELIYIKDDYIKKNLYNTVYELKDTNYNINDNIPLSLFKSAFGESFLSNNINNSSNKISIILKKTTNYNKIDCAVFDINLIMNVPFEKNFSMLMNLKGEIIVSTEKLWIMQINLTGPITVNGETDYEEGKLTLTGNGQADWNFDLSF